MYLQSTGGNEHMTNYNYTCISEVNGKHHSTTAETVNEYKVLKAYFELKEGIIGNVNTTKKIDTLNYFSDGTITDFCYTTITKFNGNTYKHKYSYRLMK